MQPSYSKATITTYFEAKLDYELLREKGGRVVFYSGRSYKEAKQEGIHGYRVVIEPHDHIDDLAPEIEAIAEYIERAGAKAHVWTRVYVRGVSRAIDSEHWECSRELLEEAAASEGVDLAEEDGGPKANPQVSRLNGDVVGTIVSVNKIQNEWLLDQHNRQMERADDAVVKVHELLVALTRAQVEQEMFTRVFEAESKHQTLERMAPIFERFIEIVGPDIGASMRVFAAQLARYMGETMGGASAADSPEEQEGDPLSTEQKIIDRLNLIAKAANELGPLLDSPEGKAAVLMNTQIQRTIWGLVRWAEGAQVELLKNGITPPTEDAEGGAE